MKRFICGILVLISLNALGSFRVVNQGVGFQALQFNDHALLSKYYQQEIMFSSFQGQALYDLENQLKKIFKCESLTDERVVRPCLEKLKARKISGIGFSLPFYYSSESSHFSDIFDKFSEALKSELEGIALHEDLRALIGSGQFSGYGVVPNTFDTWESKRRLRALLRGLAAYPANVADPDGFCDVQMTRDSLKLEESNYQENDTYDMNKCENLIMSFDNWAYGLQKHPLSDNPFELFHPDLKAIVDEHLTEDIAAKLYSLQLTKFYQKDLKVNRVSELVLDRAKEFLADKVRKTTNVSEAFDYLARTSPFQNVRYEGISGVHFYLDDVYRAKVAGVAEHFMANDSEVGEYVKREGLSRMFVDTNTAEELSRLEPIDLISNLMYRKLVGVDFVSSVGANSKNYLKEVVKYTVGLEEKLSHPVYIFPRKPDAEVPGFLCAYPDKDEPVGFPLMSFLNSVEIGGGLPDQVSDGDGSSSSWEVKKFVCADQRFTLKREDHLERPLKLPPEIDINDGYVDILMPYSLTAELNDNLIKLAKMYFRALKYRLHSQKVDDVKAYVADQISSVDVLMPAGHSLASRDLSIGTKKGKLLTFTRERKRGQKYGARFKFLIPDISSSSETINIEELASAYEERMSVQENPLFVFVISCNSENNLRDWSLIYRRAMERVGGDKGMLPFVIASSRGFPTSNNIDIASSIFYPSDVADMLAKGMTPELVYKNLERRKYGSIAKELLKRIGSAWLPFGNKSSKKGSGLGDIFKAPEVDTYSPVYNLSDEHREMTLKMSGKRYRLFQEETLIMDETF